MSKTLGNVIDPVDTIKEFGTDALRFTLSLGTAGQVCLVFNLKHFLSVYNVTASSLKLFAEGKLQVLHIET